MRMVSDAEKCDNCKHKDSKADYPCNECDYKWKEDKDGKKDNDCRI